jgi:hypothetical protein
MKETTSHTCNESLLPKKEFVMTRSLIASALVCLAASTVALAEDLVSSSDLPPAQAPASTFSIPPSGEHTLVMRICRKDGPPWLCELQEQLVEGLDMHPGTAFMQAQPLVQRWAEDHPGYAVRGWRLRPGRGT